MKYLVILPHIHFETTKRCLDSLDVSVLKNTVVVNNASNGQIFDFQNKVEIIDHRINLGVARSWNLGVNILRDTKSDYLIIISASMGFTDGMLDILTELEKNNGADGLMTQHGWHCLAIHNSVFRRVGLFDTNFYPGYYEDSDFIRRMELANIHDPIGKKNVFPHLEVMASPSEVAHGMKKGLVKVNMQACAGYFIKKWGDYPRYDSQEDRDKLYKYPFNDPTNKLSWFPNTSINALKIMYNL